MSRGVLVETDEEPVKDALAADLTPGCRVVPLPLEGGSELGGGDEEGARLADRLEVAIAIDGKVLRGSQPKRASASDSVPGTYLVAAYAHASGLVVGQVRAAGTGHEVAAAKALLKQVPIAQRVVTADALLTQRDISEQIVTDRGDDLFPIDDTHPALLADAEAALSPLDGSRAPADRPASGGDGPARLAPASARRAGRAHQLVPRRLTEGAPWPP